jgi:small-conductance mechanosensitive channel
MQNPEEWGDWSLFAIMDITFWQNSLMDWLIALTATLTAIVLLGIIKKLLISRLSKLATKTKTFLDDDFTEALKHTKGLFLFIVSLYLGAQFVELPDRADIILSNISVIALFIQTGLWASVVLTQTLDRYRKKQLDENPASVTTISAIGFVGKLLLWSVVLLLALDNLGINVTALIAGLGVGGIAVALAVQNILGDLLAALSIVLDKPFTVGDFLIVDDFLGSVENVGLKTTRIRSLSGEQLVFSNSDLLSSRLRNYGRMFERRVAFPIGVTYQTPREQLEKIPSILRQAVEAQENVRFDRSHFKEYGNFSLNFETVYYVKGPDYNLYMDIQQAINLHIHKRFEEESIEFAYPTQTLYVMNRNGTDQTHGGSMAPEQQG